MSFSECRYAECNFDEFCYTVIMLRVVTLNGVMPIVIILSVVFLIVIMLSVVTPYDQQTGNTNSSF